MNLIAAIVAMCCAAGSNPEQDSRIQAPTRRAVITPVAPLEELPPDADLVEPQTLEIVTRVQPIGGNAETWRETVTRTVERIHLLSPGREWLFVRNAKDPRRVSGTLVDHAERTVVHYDESDLRNLLGMNGWADALRLGFEPGFNVERRAGSVNRALLRNAAERFPEYKVVDIAEWLERR